MIPGPARLLLKIYRRISTKQVSSYVVCVPDLVVYSYKLLRAIWGKRSWAEALLELLLVGAKVKVFPW